MLKHFFLIAMLLLPSASWAACTSQQVGKETFVDCAAEGLVINNPATSGITLQPLPDAAVKVAPDGKIRSPATLEAGGQWRSTTENVSGKAKATPIAP